MTIHNQRKGDHVGHKRDMYFLKHIENQTTPEKYLMALRMSPYKTHRRAAKEVERELKLLKGQHAAIIKESNDTSENNSDSRADD
jgi:hypothetical protein